VEDLRAGDAVVTASGATVRVQWVGHRSLDLTRHPRPERVRPVRVAAHAFGHGRPHTDLFVSPAHALFLDGVLIPAEALIDGGAVAQVAPAAVVYHHVELAVHDVLVANGLPAESFLDCGNRADFENHDGPVRLHPDFASLNWEMACAPFVVAGPVLERVRAGLAAPKAAPAERGRRLILSRLLRRA